MIIEYYKNSGNDIPQRHFYTKFIKDYKQWAQKYFDYIHYTIPIPQVTSDGF